MSLCSRSCCQKAPSNPYRDISENKTDIQYQFILRKAIKLSPKFALLENSLFFVLYYCPDVGILAFFMVPVHEIWELAINLIIRWFPFVKFRNNSQVCFSVIHSVVATLKIRMFTKLYFGGVVFAFRTSNSNVIN